MSITVILFVFGGVAFSMVYNSSDPDNGLSIIHDQAEGLSLREIVRRRLHHGSGRYLNPWTRTVHGRFLEVLRWKLASPNGFRKYYKDEHVRQVNIDWSPVMAHEGLSITFITHSSVLIRDKGKTILIDPVFSGLSWPVKDFTPVVNGPSVIPSPDYVLITHGHYDHLDIPTVSSFTDSPQFLSPLGYHEILRENGVKNIRELDWFDTYSDGSREIILVPCNHWTMRSPFVGPNTALWGSYIIRTSTGPVIYISGDTAYFPGFSEIGQEFPIDLAIFNLGAYEPRWFMKKAHINPEETVNAFRELGAKRLMIVHWGTFRLGDEPVYFPPVQLRQEMEKVHLADRLVEIHHGQTLYLDDLLDVR